jgi:hypothetical protein
MGKQDSRQEQGWRSRLKWVLIGVAAWGMVVGGGTEVLADPSTLKQDFRLWAPVYMTVPLSTSFLGYMEVNPRFGDDVSNLDQLLLRPAIGYKLNDHWSVWQGYAWVGSFEPNFIKEDRLFQQLIYKETFSFGKILSRSRLEERFIDHTEGTGFRARTMLRVDVPLPDIPDWGFVTYDEIFFNLNGIRGGPEGGFDQNRFFIGLNYKFMKEFNMDAGYQMQLLNNRTSQLANQMNNMILLQFWINL